MEFKRTLNPSEIAILGDNCHQYLHQIIDDTIKRISLAQDSSTAESRVLSLMSGEPMNARAVMESHNVVYGNKSNTLAYIRVVIIGLHKAGLITRVSRGMYVRLTV